MPYAVKSEEFGTYVGQFLGMVFWSKLCTGEQYIAYTEETKEGAEDFIEYLLKGDAEHNEAPILSCEDLSVVEVKTGHWKDLQAAGLDIGDMITNELTHAEPMSSDTGEKPEDQQDRFLGTHWGGESAPSGIRMN